MAPSTCVHGFVRNILSAALSAVLLIPGVFCDWQPARGTWFEVENGDLKTANCHMDWSNIQTGHYVGALSDKHPSFASSCGVCYEVRCQNADFQDGYGQTISRSNACRCGGKSVVITVADACPCSYPNNQHSNGRWCCQDRNSNRDHIDITYDAFKELADPNLGVIAMEYRQVSCDTKGSTTCDGGSSGNSDNSGSNSGSSNNNNGWDSQSSQMSQPQMSSDGSGIMNVFRGWFGGR